MIIRHLILSFLILFLFPKLKIEKQSKEFNFFRDVRFSNSGDKVFFSVFNRRYDYKMVFSNGYEKKFVSNKDSLFEICSDGPNTFFKCFDNYCDTFCRNYSNTQILEFYHIGIEGVRYDENSFKVQLLEVDSMSMYEDFFNEEISVYKFKIGVSFKNDLIDSLNLINTEKSLSIDSLTQKLNEFEVFKARDHSYYLLLGKFKTKITSKDKLEYLDLTTDVSILYKGN